MKRATIIEKLDNIKYDYQYDINGKEKYEFKHIFNDLYYLFFTRVLRTKIKDDYNELKEKILQKKEKKEYFEEIENKLESIIIEYDNIRNEAEETYIYYSNIIFNLTNNYYKNYEKANSGEIFTNICKDIFDLNIKMYINYEKRLISFINIIKDIKNKLK